MSSTTFVAFLRACSMAARLVRGAFQKDFRDRFAVELALFELTVVSGTDEFRAISKLVK